MASKHSEIQIRVITDWTLNHRGRLYIVQQGSFRNLHSDGITRISPYPKKQPGYPDLHGFELINNIPVYCLIEVKTKSYSTLTKEQKNHLDYCVSIGGRAYVAREADNEVGYVLEVWTPCS